LVNTGSEITGSEAVWDMAEFFVVRRYRRRGVGTDLAHQVWRRFPGKWEVRVKDANLPAQYFWQRAISAFAKETVQSIRIEKSGEFWQLFSFESKGK
jgi:predicted acetyltransferase